MSKIFVQNEVQSDLGESLTVFLKSVDQEREELKRQKIAWRYAQRNNALHADVLERITLGAAFERRLNRLAGFAHSVRVRANRTSPSQSRLLFPMAWQSYLRA